MLKVFGLGGSEAFAKKVVSYLDIPLSVHKENHFEDKEVYVKSEENVRGCDVYVITSLCSDENYSIADKFITLLFFIGSLKDASAGRISVVSPLLGYSRQDRKTESRAPINTKYVAELLETAGVNRLLTMDVHNLSAFQNAFRIPTDNLEARPLFLDYLTGIDKDGNAVSGKHIEFPSNAVILAPDSGSVGRCRRYRQGLEKRTNRVNQIDLAYLDKERINGTTIKGNRIIGDVKGKEVLIVDDLIATATTIRNAADAVERDGGHVFAVCATHGLFTSEAEKNLSGLNVIVSNTVPRTLPGLNVVETAQWFAMAIRRTHEDGGSISQLLQT